MKKNKTVAFMLAATLMVGGTFLGTKAWFTDSDTASNDLVITMGSMGIKTSSSEWTAVGESESSPDSGNDFTNVRPGDEFKKTVTVTNTGSLSQKLSVSGGSLISNAVNKEYFTITHTAASLNDVILDETNGNKTTFEIKVKINGTDMKDKATEELTNHLRKFELDKYLSDIEITANQINKTE